MILHFFLLAILPLTVANSLWAPPMNVTIGAQFPIHKTARFNFMEDGGGRRRLAAFLLAIDQINDKNDGFYDDLLPETELLFAKYDSKRNEGEAVVNAFYIWEQAQAKVAIGPASSGPSKQSQSVFKLPHVNIPQVSYSATSSGLSDASASPMFMRTAPSDVYQAEIMASTAQLQGWTKVCIMSGTDAYSAAGAAAVSKELDKTNIQVLRMVSYEAETSSVEEQIGQLKSAGCPIVILWAQSGDMKTIVVEADKQGLSASNPFYPTLFFTSEITLGSFEDVCKDHVAECGRVFRGALCATPNFGPGTPSYKTISDIWHAQIPKIGTTGGDRTSAAGCDNRTDVRGKGVWLVDHDVNSSTPDKCAAIDFNDYIKEEAEAYVAESSGDGRISMYVPFAYDATLMIATGLHSLFTSDEWKTATTETDKETVYDGKNIYHHMLISEFDGFSGEVSFRCSDTKTCSNTPKEDITQQYYEGDRQAGTMDFFLWNYDGVEGNKFVKFGEFVPCNCFVQVISMIDPICSSFICAQLCPQLPQEKEG